MAVKKEHIVIAVLVLAVCAGFGAVYQFYFKVQLKGYAKDRADETIWENKLADLEKTFQGFEPRSVVSVWKGQVQPWTDALFARSGFFDMAKSWEIDPVPEKAMLKFHYRDKSKEMLDALLEKVRAHVPPCSYPNPTRFGAPDASAFAMMNRVQVANYLALIKFGSSVVEMLMDAKAVEITRVVVWPKRTDYENLLNVRTTGLEFKMTMENLTKFIEQLRSDSRYFSVNAISIQNRRLRLEQEPVLEVRMLLTQTQFIERTVATSMAQVSAAAQPASASAPVTGPGSQPARTAAGREGVEGQPLTKWGKVVKWLKFNFWPF